MKKTEKMKKFTNAIFFIVLAIIMLVVSEYFRSYPESEINSEYLLRLTEGAVILGYLTSYFLLCFAILFLSWIIPHVSKKTKGGLFLIIAATGFIVATLIKTTNSTIAIIKLIIAFPSLICIGYAIFYMPLANRITKTRK